MALMASARAGSSPYSPFLRHSAIFAIMALPWSNSSWEISSMPADISSAGTFARSSSKLIWPSPCVNLSQHLLEHLVSHLRGHVGHFLSLAHGVGDALECGDDVILARHV